jgi:hypothetical protein
MKKIKTFETDDEFERVCDAITKYLKRRGWLMLVAGPIYIEHHPPLKNNFRFVVDFTGAKKRGTAKG